MKKTLKFILGLVSAFIAVIIILLVVDISNDDETNQTNKEVSEVENIEGTNDTKKTTEDTSDTNTKSSAVLSTLKSNNFVEFVEEYNKLGSDKTTIWDNELSGSTVEWTGTVVKAGTSQIFLYGPEDYNGESWTELGDQNKLFYTFVAKYANPDDFDSVKEGDRITVQGSLDSRGDKDLNFNWKIYNAELK